MPQQNQATGTNTGQGEPLGCNHTEQHKSSDGQLVGSWVEIKINSTSYVACNYCGIRFGSHSQLSEDAVRRAYLEQQHRLACPGCGEEPFLG